MKKSAIRVIAILLLLCTVSVQAYGAEYLIPGGQVIGLVLQDNTVTIAAFDHTMQAAKKGGLQIGDEIVTIDGRPIQCAADVKTALDRSKGQIEMVIRRQETDKVLSIAPEITAQGPKLGVFLKEGITGIGTVTWYDPDTGAFGSLGHGVHGKDGTLLDMVSGAVFDASVRSVQKGQAGDPGQLHGSVEGSKAIGKLEKNTSRGVFGSCPGASSGEAIPIGRADDVKVGAATILSTVSGDTAKEYSVEILKLFPQDSPNGRNLLIKVTDPALLGITGGIVQGMGVSYNKDNQWNP